MTEIPDHLETSSGLVAIIPARGGSKRIPRKNIRPFLGVPLIARTIKILRSAELLDRIIVSTDDDEIARIAIDAGADAPFRRPSELADDHTPTAPVIADAITRIEATRGPLTEPVFVVYPAAVFMRPEDLHVSLDLLREHRADLVFTGTKFPAPIMRAWRQGEDGTCEMVWPEHALTRSQDLAETYWDAGQLYVARKEYWAGATELAKARPRVTMHVLPRWRAQDIDDLEDWDHAEALFTALE